MRLLQNLLVLAVVIGALLPAAVFADEACFESAVTAQMEQDGLHVQVTLTNWYWGFCWFGDFTGVDVYRRDLGLSPCGPPVLVTDNPLPWTGMPVGYDESFVLGEFVDGDAVANMPYEYIGRPVDAQRNPIPGNDDIVLGYASVGEALIGHGFLYRLPGCLSLDSWIEPCDSECLPGQWIASVPTGVISSFNDGTTYRIYGEYVGLSSYRRCNVNVPQVNITRVVPSVCVVGVEPASWGKIKSIYR